MLSILERYLVAGGLLGITVATHASMRLPLTESGLSVPLYAKLDL